MATVAPHRFLNALLDAGIPFRHARVAPDGLRLTLTVSGFRRLRPVVRGVGARVRLAGVGGLPFVLARMRRRRALLAVAGITAAALYVLSGYVWFVQVQGADRVAAEEVVAAARRLGLAPGVRRSGLDPAELGRDLQLLVPDVSWAGVNLYGTLAVIDVVERVRPAPAYEQAAAPGDVVAAEGGVVAAVTVLHGQARVRPGERVQLGQVLIAGVGPAPASTAGRGPGAAGEAGDVPVHASGVVLVRRWYAARAEVARTVHVAVPTGRVFTRMALVVGLRALYLAGWRRVPFRAYVLRRTVTGPLRWRNLPLPVEAVTLRYLEVTRFVRRLTIDDARSLAAARARAALYPRLPRRARIVEERQQTVLLPGHRVGVELLVESEENIGVFRGAPVAPAPAPAGGTP